MLGWNAIRLHTLQRSVIHLMNRNYRWAVSDLAAKTVGGVERRNVVDLSVADRH